MLSHHIISVGMLNTGKCEVKQAYFILPFTVSTGIKLNRKQPYSLSFSGWQRYRYKQTLWIQTRMRMLGTMRGGAIVNQSHCYQVRARNVPQLTVN